MRLKPQGNRATHVHGIFRATLPLPAKQIEVHLTYNEVLNGEKEFLVALDNLDSVDNDPNQIASGWPYSGIVGARYVYLPVTKGAPTSTLPMLKFSRPVSEVGLSIRQWRNKHTPPTAVLSHATLISSFGDGPRILKQRIEMKGGSA